MECSASMHTPCTTTICNTATYRCTNVGGAWQWGSSTTCDDSDLCTYNDVCSGSTCAGTPIICADEACTDSECNGTASCTVTYPSGTTCSDSDPCTTGETCNGAGSCTGGTPAASCGDGSCNCGETISTCPADCTPVCVLPRTLASWEGSAEGWSTSGNWTLQGSGGSPGGYMNFDDATPSHLTDYSHALLSPVMDLGGCTAVSLRYKIKLSDYLESSWSNDEHLRVQCSGNGSAWTTLRTFTDGDDYSDMSFGWTQYTHALPIECKTTTAYIRFLAEGDDSWDIWYWGIDTVSLEP